MKQGTAVVITLFLIALVTIYVAAENKSGTNGTTEVYRNEEPPYSLQYPSGWRVDASRATPNESFESAVRVVGQSGTVVIDLVTEGLSGHAPFCKFKDTSLPEDQEYDQYFGNNIDFDNQDYVEFQNKYGSLRRVEDPDEKGRWLLCHKVDSDRFYQLTRVSYEENASLTNEDLVEMDAIVSSLKPDENHHDGIFMFYR